MAGRLASPHLPRSCLPRPGDEPVTTGQPPAQPTSSVVTRWVPWTSRSAPVLVLTMPSTEYGVMKGS